MILIYLVAGWVLGIFAASILRLPTSVWLWLCALPLGYFVLFRGDALLRKWHVVLVLFLLGALRYQLALPGELDQQLQEFNDQGRASLVGIVVADPEVRETQTLVRVAAAKIQAEGVWRNVHGLALVSVPRDTRVKYGDEVQVDGAPGTPPDGADFSYREYLARENVFTLIRYARLYVITSGHGDPFWAALYDLRDAAQTAINQLLPEPSAALLNGILLGDDRGLPDEVRASFNNTNTAHIIAISGFNIAVLIGVLTYVFRKPANALQARALNSASAGAPSGIAPLLAQHLVTVLILLFLVLYTLLVGASASVVRACIMGSLVVIAFALGRPYWALTALAFSALVMSLLNPHVLWDVGFQLSFIATLGLVVYVPRLQDGIKRGLQGRVATGRARQILYVLNDSILVTLAAFLVTAPLIILYFHRVSLIGFLTNFLILPVQPPIMILGGGATLLQMLANALEPIPLVGLVPAALAQVVGWGAFIFLQYTILVVQSTAAVPYGSFVVERVDLSLAILFYAALAVVTWLGVRRAFGILFAKIWIPIALLAAAVVFVWTSSVAWSDARTRVIFVGSAQGDATFIRTREDYRILINGTGEPGTLLSFLGEQLPPWDRRIDLVVATHLDDGNLSSLNAVLERYAVGTIVEASAPARPGVSFAKWRESIETQKLPAHAAEAGMGLRAGEAEMEVILPTTDERPTTNIVLRVHAEGKTLLLAPELTVTEQRKLVETEAVLDADMAVLPNQMEQEFLERVTPETVILFVGRRPSDQPTVETLELLEGMTVLRTDERGTITFAMESESVQMHAAK